MYSGTTFRRSSGNVIGAHQKIDRLARRHIKDAIPSGIRFPTIKDILHFEGNNGPDAIKRKSPSKDEPWHYIDPEDMENAPLVKMIEDHSVNLTKALSEDNEERAAFEAAWLAHAIVDGLTPAHHYPLEKKIEELWGHPKEHRVTVKQKNIIKGLSYRDTFRKNWEYWGAKGVFTTHFMFEFGVASTIAPLSLPQAKPSPFERLEVMKNGIGNIFTEAVREVHHLKMYERFYKQGWNRTLARQTKQELAPIIVRTIALAWYESAEKASEIKQKNNRQNS